MIRFVPVRAIAIALVVASASSGALAAPRKDAVAIYWQPPGQPALGVRAHGAFDRAVAPIAVRRIDATAARPQPASLIPALDAAKADYARFAFAEAITALTALEKAAAAEGGGDLDRRQLSEIFFYRGLARLETEAAAAAWDDLVRAARLDPNRVVDPNAFTPRAVTAYKRAVTEVAAMPGAELVVVAPAGARIVIDGEVVTGAVKTTLGQHHARVEAAGFAPWAGVVAVSSERERLAPKLVPDAPPDADALLALAGQGTARMIVGALERAERGWQFRVRDLHVPGGVVAEDVTALGDVPTEPAIAALVQRTTMPAPPPAKPKQARSPRKWGWIAAGSAAVVLVVVVGVVASSDSDSVGGTVP